MDYPRLRLIPDKTFTYSDMVDKFIKVNKGKITLKKRQIVMAMPIMRAEEGTIFFNSPVTIGEGYFHQST